MIILNSRITMYLNAHTDCSQSDILLKPRPLILSHLPRVPPTLEVKVHLLSLVTLQDHHTTREDRYTTD